MTASSSDNEAQKKATILGMIALFLLFVPAFLYIFFAPIAPWSSLIYLTAYALPATACLAVFLLYRRNKQRLSKLPLSDLFKAIFANTIFLSYITVALLFTTNIVFDRSIPETKTFQIIAKDKFHWGRSTSYSVNFLSPFANPLSSKINNMETDCDISWQRWNLVIPYKTQITLKIHQGFLGLPWYESGNTLSNLAQ